MGEQVKKFLLLMTGVVLLTAGCGFQLRGDWRLPAGMKQTVISGGNEALYRRLQKEFRIASSNLSRTGAANSDAQIPHLMILQDRINKQVLSVDNRGKVIEYALVYTLRFKLMDGNGKPIMAEQTININRDYRFGGVNVLATDQEEALLKKEMQRDMARRMMRQIQAQTQP